MLSLSAIEFDSLHAIFNSTGGNGWTYSSGKPWNFSQPNPDPCAQAWQGVTCATKCNSTTCQDAVSKLELISLNLSGTLPTEIGTFSSLEILYIYKNRGLHGTLPVSLGNLNSLQTLVCYFTSVSGTIPSSLGRLGRLELLKISDNYMTGQLPNEIFNLTSLITLDLSVNTFEGSLSRNISRWSDLRVLQLKINLFTGTLPESLVDMKSLQQISIYQNSFHGSLPATLVSSKNNLSSLSIYQNLLTGSLPLDWGGSTNLALFEAAVNSFHGDIPLQLYRLPKLVTVVLGDNLLSGTISSLLSEAPVMMLFVAQLNVLSGTIPSSLGSQQTLYELYIGQNPLTGTIPRELGNMSMLNTLSVQDCLLTGSLPTGLTEYSSMETLDASSNMLSGTIPDDIFQSPILQGLLLEDNLLTGTIQPELGQMSALQYLLLDHNLYYGTVPKQLSQLVHLGNFGLGNNHLSGIFDVFVGNMTYLAIFQVEMNLFTGTLDFLPASGSWLEYFNITNNYFFGSTANLAFMSNMLVLDCSYNLLSGSLPSISSMAKLYYFFAQSNSLEGSVYSFLQRGVHLEAIDISSNQLTGSMPNDLHIMMTGNSLASFAAIQNCFTGTIPESFCNLTSLQVLALDGLSTAKACRRSTLSSLLPQVHSYTLGNHAIHGSIPKCLFSMPKLRTLHLSGNGLEGSIPVEEEQELGVYLGDLSLSHNQLTGSLPPPLRGGSRWINLDVSYNKLKGELQLESGGESGDGSAWTNSSSTSYSNSSSSAGSSSGFSVNASIYLNINRLSGRIPGFYYDIGGAEGELNMLEGNMFACPEAGLSSDVPSADPYRLQYGCGSDNLNSALLAWTGLALFIFGFISLFVYFARKEKSVVSSAVDGNRKHPEDDTSGSVYSHDDMSFLRSHEPSKELHAPSWYPFRVCCTALQHNFLFLQLANWCDDLILWQKADWQILTSTPSACMRNVTGWDSIWIAISNQMELRRTSSKYVIVDIFESGKLLSSVRRYVLWLTVCMICVGGPVYGSLTVYYGSYNHEYAWTLSAGYLSGIGASCVLLVYFMVLIGLVSTMYLDGSRGVSRRQQQHTHGQDSSTEGEECTVNVLHAQECSTSQSERSATGPSSNSITERKKLDWRAVLLVKVCIAVVNISIVLVVNGFYVYIYMQIERWSAMMLSVALSLFKVYWSMLVQLGIVHLLQPLQQQNKTKEKAGSLHEENVGFMSSLMLFNTIVAPCLATMIASSDCFYYVFASPQTINASYTFEQCELFGTLGCDSFSSATHSFDFAPPFSYTYQCSSAMLVDYAYVFAYKYILIGILYPVFILSVVLHGEWMRSGRGAVGEKQKASYALESLLPLLWRIEEIKHEMASTLAAAQKGRDGVQAESIVSTPMTKLPAPVQGTAGTTDMQSGSSSGAIAFPTLSISRCYFSSGDYVVRLTMMLGCLLTFGAVLPYLAILIAFSIVSNTYLTQVGWLRVLERWVSSKRRKTEKTSMIDMPTEQADGDSGKSGDGKNAMDSECVEEKKTNEEHDVIEALPASVAVTMTTTICEKDQPEEDGDEGEQRQERQGIEKRLEKDKVEDVEVDKMLLEIGEECGRMEQGFDRATRPLFLLLPFFYACYLFDTSGDEEGGWVGFYFVIAWLAAVMGGSLLLYLWRKRKIGTSCMETVEIVKKAVSRSQGRLSWLTTSGKREDEASGVEII
eukprot:scaffold654_cov207-Ochromonas_danica.AAC.33